MKLLVARPLRPLPILGVAAWIGLALVSPAHADDASLDEGSAPAASGRAGVADVDVPPDAPVSVVVTLDRALSDAERLVPTVGIAASELEDSRLRAMEAQLAWLPKLEFTAALAPVPRITEEDNDQTSEVELLGRLFTEVGPYVKAEVNAIFPLYTFGKITLAGDLAQVGVEVDRIELDKVRREARFQVYRAYVAVQWYREVHRLLREAETRIDRAEEELELRLDEGDPTARTALREITIYRADFTKLQGQADQAGFTARSGLRIGLDLPTDFGVERLDETVPSDAPPPLEEVLAWARSHRPDLQLLDRAVEARRLNQKLEWRMFTPDLFLGTGVSGAWAPTIEDLKGPYVNDPYNRFGFAIFVGMRLSLDLPSRLVKGWRAEQAVVTAERQRDAVRSVVELEVTQAYHEARAAERTLLAYVEAKRAAHAWLKQRAFQFDQGLASFDDLVDPLKTYYATAGSYYQAVLDYRLKLADLALKSGADDFRTWPGRPVE